MLEVVVSGLVTGWAIAIPIGAVGAFLVALAARTSFRVGGAAALGIASVDGVYAACAVVGGTGLAALLDPVADELRIASATVLVLIAALMLVHALRRNGRPPRDMATMRPRQAYALFFGITAVNPTTVVYFAAVVLGNRDLVSTPAEGFVFVLAAFTASALWQLLLAGGGASLGRLVTTPRGQLWTGVVSALVILGLAGHTVLS